MSLLGKILAIFNVLAVIGALALMGMTYGKQRVWEYSVFRQKLMMNGLPVDPGERDEKNQPLGDNIGPTTQKELFPQNPITTQKAEVERVRGELQSKIQGAGDKKKQIYLYARVLTPMALTYEQRARLMAYQTYLRDDKAYEHLKERLKTADEAEKKQSQDRRVKPYDEAFNEALAAQYTDPPGPLADEFLAVKKADPKMDFETALGKSLDNHLAQLQGQFEKMFQDALEGTTDASKTGASPQKRRVIAFLLFNMVNALPDEAAGDAAAKPSNLWDDPKYKRFLNVVGVRAAAEAVNDEAVLLKAIAGEVETARLRERGIFAIEHRFAIDLVEEKSALLEAHNLLYARKQKELATHEETLKKRELDVKFYEDQLAAARKETAGHLKALREMSDKLLQARVELRDATEKNQKLEKDIRALEGAR
ncbi:MAG TPA: hypothetical protein VH682_27210 [Gemmataceae bacterium]|jgi:hypothetical protein